MVAWIFFEVFLELQHIRLFNEKTAIDILTTLKTKPRMLIWLLLLVPLTMH